MVIPFGNHSSRRIADSQLSPLDSAVAVYASPLISDVIDAERLGLPLLRFLLHLHPHHLPLLPRIRSLVKRPNLPGDHSQIQIVIFIFKGVYLEGRGWVGYGRVINLG